MTTHIYLYSYNFTGLYSVFCCVEGRPIPTELRADALELKKAMKYDDAEREG